MASDELGNATTQGRNADGEKQAVERWTKHGRGKKKKASLQCYRLNSRLSYREAEEGHGVLVRARIWEGQTDVCV